MTTTYVNGIMNGPYMMYYDNGTLFAEGNHVNGRLFGEVKSYTPAGKLAKIEVWDTVPNKYMNNQMMSRLVDETIFWQEIPGENNKYLFVSDRGYCKVKGGVYNKDTLNIPDNIIETRDTEDGADILIWKNGKKEFYKHISRN